MKMFLVLSLLVFTGCAKSRLIKLKGEPGTSCTVQDVKEGTLIVCTDGSEVFVPDGVDGERGRDGADGTNGLDGQDGADGKDAVIEVIDPCGDDPDHFDEVLLRLSSGELIAYFKDGNKEFLVSIEPGTYTTTDKQQCDFEVTEDLEVL